MIGNGTSGGAIGIGATRSGTDFGCGSGQDDLVILSRGKVYPVSAGNAGCQRRPTGKFDRPGENGAA
jgi:hypothetical protein